jgi:hypothetical protein
MPHAISVKFNRDWWLICSPASAPSMFAKGSMRNGDGACGFTPPVAHLPFHCSTPPCPPLRRWSRSQRSLAVEQQPPLHVLAAEVVLPSYRQLMYAEGCATKGGIP